MKSLQPTHTHSHSRRAFTLRSFWLAVCTILFSASFAQAAQLTLTWSDNAANEAGFEIERATAAAGPFARLATVTSNTTTYTDASVAGETRYYYRVRAFNSAGTSAFTSVVEAVVSGTTPPTDPLPTTKSAQTISFAPLASRTYGSANFTLTATASSGLPVTYSSSNTSVATVSGNVVTIFAPGSTTITASQAGDATYNPATIVQQTLTVNKAVLTVTAASKSMTVGGTVPALTATFSGYVNGQTSSTSGVTGSPALSTTATSTSPAGTYPITVSAGTLAAANYSFRFVNGTLTVNAPTTTKTSQTISFGSLLARTYGAAPFTLSATASSGLAVSYTSSNTAVATVSGNTVTIRGAGSTIITASQTGNTTYSAAASVKQTLTVNKAPLTVTADSKTKYTGATMPVLSATITGFVNGETSTTSGITGAPALATTATRFSPAGVYPIMVSIGTLSAPNYSFTSFISGTLTVRNKKTTTQLSSAEATGSQLTNISVRSAAATGDEMLTVGFTTTGTETKTLLVRGVGPALGKFGVTNPLPDPSLSLYTGTTEFEKNDDWTSIDATAVEETTTAVGGFPLSSGSKDSAVLTKVNAGSYTAQITGKPNDAGVVLAEIYDADKNSDSRLVNVSARAKVGRGNDVLIAGFVVEGSEPRQYLVRAVGPTLADYGVSRILSDPTLRVVPQGTNAPLAQNDNWGDTDELKSAFSQVGAFELRPGSKDAAVVVTLQPGAYTAVVSGTADETGVAIIEVYELP